MTVEQLNYALATLKNLSAVTPFEWDDKWTQFAIDVSDMTVAELAVVAVNKIKGGVFQSTQSEGPLTGYAAQLEVLAKF